MTAPAAPDRSTPGRTVRRRRPLALDADRLVQRSILDPVHALPLVITPCADALDLSAWAEQQRDALERELLDHGAILFRGFACTDPARTPADGAEVETFERVIRALSGGALPYQFRASPRTRVGGNIYTSTDYPADQPIFPHNEHAYSPRFPLRIFFYCQSPAEQGGATPIGSNREILRRIPAPIVERFRAKGVLYVRNYGDGFGLPWQTVFQTDDRAEVEAYCASVGIDVEWKAGDRLRTRQKGAALLRHPRSGEEVWFNHATFFHVSTLPPAVRDPLLAAFDDADLPTQTYYGDGSRIEAGTLAVLRAAYVDALVSFPWQRGDVLMLDNMLAVHGREPYTGPRATWTGMADACSAADLARTESV